MGVSCLSLSSRAVGKEYFRTGTAESQGWRPAFVRPHGGSVHVPATVPFNGHKTGTSRISVLFLFYPRFTQERDWGTDSPSHSCKMYREKGEQRKKRKTPVFPASAGTGRKCTAPFFKSQAGMELEMELRRIQQNQGSRDIFYIFTVYFYTLVPLFIYFIKYICE